MDRPFVMINMAMSADGKITSAARETPRMTSVYDRDSMDRLRARADAVLIGAQTARADAPKLYVRNPEIQKTREEAGKRGLLKVLVSASARIDPASRVFDDPDDGGFVVVTVDETKDDVLAGLPEGVEVWKVGRGRVDLARLLGRLAGRGVETLLVEGGGELNWQIIDGGLFDELYVTIAPSLIGGRDAPTLLEGAGRAMAERVRLRLLDLHREGDELYCRYGVVR